MPEKWVTKGVVLRETDTKEADKILTVLTAERGRVPVVARGARRRNSKIAAASQLLAFSELVLFERNGWWLLDEASTLALFDNVRRDVLLLSLASYFAELTEAVAAEETPSGELTALLLNALYALDTRQKPLAQVKAAFELKLLALSGYEPLTDGCAVCGAQEPDAPVFDCERGLLLCRSCAAGGEQELDRDALAAMRFILRGEVRRMLAFRLRDASMTRLAAVCERFAAVQLERRFRTLDFYRGMLSTLEDGGKT